MKNEKDKPIKNPLFNKTYIENLKRSVINIRKNLGVDIERKPKSKTKSFEDLFNEKK